MKGNRAALTAYVVLVLCLAFVLGYLLGTGRPATQVTVTTMEAPEKEIIVRYEEPAAPTADAPLDLNTATQAQLEALPGVGPELARRILAYREEFGKFVATEQLMDVQGIGEKKFAAIEPLVCVREP